MKTNKKEDRRVRKTKETIKSVFVDLLATKPLHAITIREIAEQADINRGTFYLHYEDIHQLLDEMHSELQQEMLEALSRHTLDELRDDTSLKFIEVFRFLKAHAKFSLVILGSYGESTFLETIIGFLRDSAYDTLRELYGEGKDDLIDQFFTFGIGGCIGVAHAWLAAGCPETPEIMGKRCDDFLRYGRQVFA